jgi:sulfite reductase alpha subunit-like flavoprotein
MCHVYVCGSSNMAQEVNRAVAKVAGKEIHDNIVQEGR